MTVVRVAFTQARWTGDKESMISLHEGWAREAADQGAQVIGFQELFEQMLDLVAADGRRLEDDELVESDVILPPRDISFEEARAEFTGEGLIPN